MNQPQAKMVPPDCVEVPLLLTNLQAQLFAKFLQRGAPAALTWATDNAAERAEMEGALWAIGRQLRAAGVKEN